jgi:hypothetical protein
MGMHVDHAASAALHAELWEMVLHGQHVTPYRDEITWSNWCNHDTAQFQAAMQHVACVHMTLSVPCCFPSPYLITPQALVHHAQQGLSGGPLDPAAQPYHS